MNNFEVDTIEGRPSYYFVETLIT
ncbi:uncharacterized protein METZ01_LOCUS196580, partial [marine metagenome]